MQAKRTKQILSANTEAPVSVEEVASGADLRTSVSREAFEALAAERLSFWERAAEPVAALLLRNNLTAADLDGVELLGGGSRVPAVKRALSKALAGRALDA